VVQTIEEWFFQEEICLSCEWQILSVWSLNCLLSASSVLCQFGNCITTGADTSYNGTDYVCKFPGMDSTCVWVGAAAKIPFLQLFKIPSDIYTFVEIIPQINSYPAAI
jgi:hypothetical protein